MLNPIFGINLGNFPIYQIMALIGFFAALIVLNASLKKAEASPFIKHRVRKSFFIGSIAGVVLANVANWFLFQNAMDASLYHRITQGGFTFIFGIAGFFAVSALLLRLYKVQVGYSLNMIVPSVLIAQFFGRIGCSLRGCCYGCEISLFGIDMHFPARELEAIFALTAFIVLLNHGFNKRFRIYAFSYGVFRFVIEFFRGDDRGSIFGIEALSPTQLVVLPIILVSAVLLFTRPVLKLFKKDDKLDMLIMKTRELFKRKDKQPYQPRSFDFTQPEKGRGIKIAAFIIAIIIVIAGIGIYLNPLNISGLNTLRYKFNDAFSFLFAQNGVEEQLGHTNGATVFKIEEEIKITSEAEAHSLVSSYDTWTSVNYGYRQRVQLENGNELYVFDQIYAEKPVLGKKRLLVTDKNGVALYIIGDGAAYTYTTEINSGFKLNTATVEQAFGEVASILSQTECWYDTGNGIVEAVHVILTDDGTTPVMGVVALKSTGQIIAYTGNESGTVYSREAGDVLLAASNVQALLSENKLDEIKIASKAKIDTQPIDIERQTVEKALCGVVQKTKADTEQLLISFESANMIARNVPELNKHLYREILACELQQTLIEAGDTKGAQDAYSKVNSAFKSAGIKNVKDEAVLAITARDKKSTFKHNINFDSDMDTFNITAEENRQVNINVETEAPVQVEVYDMSGRAIVTMFVEENEAFSLYPEDGNQFIVRVKDVKTSLEPQAAPEEYTLTVTAEEETVPQMIQNKLIRIDDAYERSNLTTFISMCAYNGERVDLETSIAMGIVAPMNDSCASCIGMEDGVDNAKTQIAALLIADAYDYEELAFLKNTEIELEYINHTQLEDAVAVKAKLRIKMGELDIYNGFTFLKLEEITDTNEYNDAQKIIGKLFSFFMGDDYYITDVNSDELYAAFGDTKESISATNDLTSLYDLWNEETEIIDGTYVYIVSFDEQEALLNGHTPEKINGFKRYTIRYNIMSVRSCQVGLQYELEVYLCFGTVGKFAYQVYNAVTNPLGTLGDAVFGQNEFTNQVWTVAKIIIDPTEVATDTVINSLFDVANSEADRIAVKITLLQAMIDNYYTQFYQLEAA